MLDLRPGCEHCDHDLPPDSTEARICTFECTFCSDCAETVLAGVCPNCGGGLVPRPIRPVERLTERPATTERTHRPVDPTAHAARLARRADRAWRLPTEEPVRQALRLFGEPSEGSELPWSWVDRRLIEAGTYWVVPRGEATPHPRPVWGLWEAGVLVLSIGSPTAVAALRTDPTVTVHLDSGTDVVVLEGRAEAGAVGDAIDADQIRRYEAKYAYRYDVAEYGGLTTIRPSTVLAWRALGWAGRDGFHQSGRWTFPPSG